jgi:hypothetical protein
MKGAFVLCEELRALDGVLGAFVLENSECIASSMPEDFDETKICEMGRVLRRAQQIASTGGYDGASLVFHWQEGSLLTWPTRDGTILGLLANPKALRETLEQRASSVLEQLVQLASHRTFPPDEVPTRREHAIPRP